MNKPTSCLYLMTTLLLASGFCMAQNPFRSLGVKESETPVLTLSNGRYPEVIENDTLIRIGSVLLHGPSGVIAGFIQTDTLYSESRMEPEIISKWLSPDPVIKPFESPYAGMGNNPILYMDPDGRDPEVAITESETNVKIRVISYVYIVAKSKEQSQQIINQHTLEAVNLYIKGGTYSGKYNDKVVEIEFATNVIAVENRKEAKEKIGQNTGVGIIAMYHKKNTRAFYDPINKEITFGDREDGRETGIFAHEIAHDFGLNERYVEMGGGLQAPLEAYWDDLMGTADYSFNQSNIDNLIENALDSRKTKGDNFVGQFVNSKEDNVFNKFKGQKKNVISYDPETKQPSEPKKIKEVQF